MAIKTIKYNDASDISLYNSGSIISNLDNLINDLKELKNSGGDTTIALQIKQVIPSKSGYNTSPYFATPALLVGHVLHELGNNNEKSVDTNLLFPRLKQIIELSYDNIDKYFEYTISDNQLNFKHPLSIKELGLISYFNPDKLVSFLRNVTDDTTPFYDQQKSYKLAHPELFQSQTEEEEFSAILKARRSTENSVFYVNYWDSATYNNTHNDITSEQHRVISLPEFTLLKLLMKGFSASLDEYKFITNNKEIFEQWLDGKQSLLLDRIAHFDPLESKYFHHFLFESLDNKVSKHFNYVLNKNTELEVPRLLTFTEFSEQYQQDPNAQHSNLNYEYSLQNEEYAKYLEKINTAILNKDFTFLDKNLPNFVIADYTKYCLYASKNEIKNINLFSNVKDMETILFLEKYNLFPVNQENKSYFLNTKSSFLQLNIDYLKHNKDALNVFPIAALANSVIENVKDSFLNLPEVENEALEEQYNTVIAPLKKLHTEIIEPYFPKQFVSLKSFIYGAHKRHPVKTLLKVVQPYLNEKSFDYLLNQFLENVNNHQTILTGLKDFLKTQNYDLSHPKFTQKLFGTFTPALKSKLFNEYRPNLNSEYKNNIAWWTVDNIRTHLQSSFKKIDINVLNSNGFSFFDKELYHFKNHNSFGDEHKFFTVISAIDDYNKHNSNDPSYQPTYINVNFHTFSEDKSSLPAFVHFINTVVENTFPDKKSEKVDTIINTLNDPDSKNTFSSSETLYRAFEEAKVAQPNFQAFSGSYSSNIEFFSPGFSKLLGVINWNQTLPHLFPLLDEKEQQRFFRNLSIAFMHIEQRNINSLYSMWESLLSSYDNYDFNIKFSLNKLLRINHAKLDDSLPVHLNNMHQKPLSASAEEFKLNSLSLVTELYFSHCSPNLLEKLMFLSVLHDNKLISDFNVKTIPKNNNNIKDMIFSYEVDLHFTQFIDLISNINSKYDFEDKSPNIKHLKSFQLNNIDSLFSKFSLAHELQEKFKEIDQTKKSSQIIKKKI